VGTRFQRYLEAVLEASDDFHEVADTIIARHATLQKKTLTLAGARAPGSSATWRPCWRRATTSTRCPTSSRATPRYPKPNPSRRARARFQRYLEAVLEASDDFHEVADIIARHAMLDALDADLRAQQRAAAEATEAAKRAPPPRPARAPGRAVPCCPRWCASTCRPVRVRQRAGCLHA
jgi:hypothetical protein